MSAGSASAGRVFPGGVAVTDLAVYDWEAEDGCRGGSPHLHTASSEGYVVVSGHGAVQTISAAGFVEHELAPGDVVWFTPGTVHRLVNSGDLRLLVVMGNAGLPEAGDAVLTFPADVLADPEAYAAAAALPPVADAGAGGAESAAGAGGVGGVASPERLAAARARRDLALAGFGQLRDGGPDAYAAFVARAAELVQPKVARWRALWESTVAAETALVDDQLTRLAAGEPGAMTAASVSRAEPTSDERAPGMCGMLHTWHWPAG